MDSETKSQSHSMSHSSKPLILTSYSSNVDKYMTDFHQALIKAGCGSVYGKDAQKGSKWVEWWMQQAEEASVVVWLIEDGFAASEACSKEMMASDHEYSEFKKEKRKPLLILPVMLKDPRDGWWQNTPNKTLKLQIITRNYIDGSKMSAQQAAEEVVKEMRKQFEDYGIGKLSLREGQPSSSSSSEMEAKKQSFPKHRAYRRGAEFYHRGCFKDAVIHLQVAAEANHPLAQMVLSYLFAWGYGTVKDMGKAKELSARGLDETEELAEQGDVESQWLVGSYFEDICTPPNYHKAVEWYEKAAAQGYAIAQTNLGVLYRNGKGVAQDYHKAKEWYEKAAAQGYAIAQAFLGALYHNGKGVAQDYHKAKEWYEKAAAQGLTLAQHNLGSLYKNGYGVAQDYQKAKEWYEKAAAQGLAPAQHNLGSLYKNGYGVAQDYQKAFEWFEKAAAQGRASAQFNLGVLYNHGQGVAQDYQKAFEWFEKAAAQGLAPAQNSLGFLYSNGYGVAQDKQKAVEWYEKAAAQGYADAQCNLGILYRNGHGVAHDYHKAKEWFEKAAAQEHANAQCYLGNLYYNGNGFPKDKQKAKEWYEKAAAQGVGNARYKLRVLFKI